MCSGMNMLSCSNRQIDLYRTLILWFVLTVAVFIGQSLKLSCLSCQSKNDSRFSLKYNFKKPNDTRALELMNAAATEVMSEFPDVVLAYGMSDEYRQDDTISRISWWTKFLLVSCLIDRVIFSIDEKCVTPFTSFLKWHLLGSVCCLLDLYRKIVTSIVSTFTAYYINHWPSHFPQTLLSNPMPSFDGRAVQYPTLKNVRDYMSWRQVDCW
jgi:tRNA(His) guanylyltransferase